MTDGEGKDACRVRKVLLIVECQYISEDPEIRVYLPQVQKAGRTEAGRHIRKAFMTAARLLAAAVLASPFAAWAAVDAWTERGYLAYGGEYLFMAAVFCFFYRMLGNFTEDRSRDIIQEEKHGRHEKIKGTGRKGAGL